MENEKNSYKVKFCATLQRNRENNEESLEVLEGMEPGFGFASSAIAP
jgi:hypothetical protein